MKRRRFVHVIFWIMAIIAAVITAVFLYLKLYGKNIIEDKLSDVLGRPIKFKGISLDLDRYSVEFDEFYIPAGGGFRERVVFSSDNLAITLDKEKFRKSREVVFELIEVQNAVLHVERNKSGELNIARNRFRSRTGKFPVPGIKSGAYTGSPAFDNALLYNFTKGFKKLVIRDSVIKFTDYHIYGVPYTLACDDFNLTLISDEMPDFMALSGTLSFKIPVSNYALEGEVLANISVAVYERMANMEINLDTGYIDVMQFQPYFEQYTPFYFKEGLFSSNTKFEIHQNAIRSLTTMAFHRLQLWLKPGMQNTQFLNENVNRLVPYLTSRGGDIIFDFTVDGSPANPQFGLGPKVKHAITMVAVQEVGKALQHFQNLQK